MRKGRNKNLLEQATDTVVSVASDVAESVSGTVSDVAGVVEDKVGDMMDAAREATHDEPAPGKKGGKLKKVLLLGALIGVGGLIFSKLKAKKDQSSNWESSYVPKAPPAGNDKPSTGDKVAEKVADKVTEAKDATVDKAEQAADKVTDAAEQAADEAKHMAQDVKDKAENA